MVPFIPILMGFSWVKSLARGFSFFKDHVFVFIIIGGLLFSVLETLYLKRVISEREELGKRVVALEQSLKEEQKLYEAMLDALEERVHDAEKRQDFEEKAQQEIQKDRELGDGPIAPVLRNSLDRLRKRQTEFGGPDTK